MLTTLPTDFIDAMSSTSRSPIQLLEFILTNGDSYYLSDTIVGTVDGLEQDYLPWIESWGTLKGNTQLQNIYSGDSLEIKTGTITIIISSEAKTFAKQLYQFGIENTVVNLYQWFKGMSSAPVLIDTMVCQDPINYSEKTMLLKLDLVSVLMGTNPPLWPTAEGYSAEPVVIGKAKGMPLKNLQTEVVTDIIQYIDATELGNVFINNGVGFPATGYVSIDSEAMAYDQITASVIHITERGAKGTSEAPHYSGAVMVPYGGIYDYSICSGPVNSVDNLVADGEPYLNEVTFFTGGNPVIARFIGRPPWLRIEPGADGDDIIPDPETSTEYGTGSELSYGGTASTPLYTANINGVSGAATMAISHTVLGGAGVLSRNSLTITNSGWPVNNWTLVYGAAYVAGGGGYLKISAGILGDCAEDSIGWVAGKYDRDDSAYDTITSVNISIPFTSAARVIGADVKCRAVFVANGGTRTTLEEWEVLAYDDVTFGLVAPWSNYTLNKAVSIANFTDLENSYVVVEFENVRCRVDGDGVATSDRAIVLWDSPTWTINYYINAGTVPHPYQELCSKFDRDLSDRGVITNIDAQIYFSAVLSNSQTTVQLVRRGTSNPADDVILSTLNLTSSLGGAVHTFSNLPITTWADLQALRLGIYQEVTGPDTEGTTRQSTIYLNYVKYIITYQPGAIETPDEQRVVYAETVVCDVTSHTGADPTPAKVVEHLIEEHSSSGQYIDAADFEVAHQNYLTEGYYLNGVLPAHTLLHDAIKTALREGLCRLTFNEGKIKLLTYFEEESEVIDYYVSEDNRQLRSSSIDNQPTTTIKNDITIRYNLDNSTEIYGGEIPVEDVESIGKFYRQEYDRDLVLVDSETVAQKHADRLLSLLAKPASIYSFNMFMPAYLLEKGDRISVRQFLDARFTEVGNILTMSRTFGQGKSQKINLFKVSIANPRTYAALDLEDTVVVDDNNLVLLKGVILPAETLVVDDTNYSTHRELTLEERVLIQEALYLDTCLVDGYGTCGYGLKGYGE